MRNPFTHQAEFEFAMFREHVPLAQRFMDGIIDLEQDKIYRIIETSNTAQQDEAGKSESFLS